MTSQKRRYDRIDSLRLLSYSCVDHENKVVSQGMGRTLNVSEGGILIETHVPLEKEGTVLLSIGFEDEVTEVRGKIAYGKRGRTAGNRPALSLSIRMKRPAASSGGMWQPFPIPGMRPTNLNSCN